MSETRATFPAPSTDRPTCCRMVVVFSTLWDNGQKPRPGVVIGDSGARTRVKVFLDETDTEAIRHLQTISGTAEAVVKVEVFDPLTQSDRDALVSNAQTSRFFWAEWPARPAPKLGIPVVGSVGGNDLTQSEVAANRQIEPAQPGKDPTGQPLHTTANPDPNAPAGDVPAAAPGSPAAPRS